MKDMNGKYYINSVDAQNNQCKDYALEKHGWVESFSSYVVIEGETPVWIPEKGFPSKLRQKSSYLKRVFSVSAPKCPVCAEKAERKLIKTADCARLRTLSLKTGIYVRFFCGGSNGGGDFVTWLR